GGTTDDILAQIEAEGANGLPNNGWQITTNENEICLKSLMNNIISPPAEYRLDYTFFVPDGISTVYLFAEVDVNSNGNDDSFWVQVNGSNTCTWNNLRGIGDGWKRAWVYNQGKDTQHAFPVTPGMNTISFFPRENGAFINWLVVTSNSQQDIQNFTFTGVTPPPVDTPVLTVAPTALIFSGEPAGTHPANQILTVQNTGSGTMTWAATEMTPLPWLTLTNTSGGNVGQITVTVNTDGMSAGTYSTQVVLNSNEASNAPVSVPVQLILSSATPVIALSPPAISFSGVEGGASPAIQQVTISNSGTGELNWNAEKSENTTWLSLADTTGSSGGKLSLQANITGLSAGTYQTAVSISAVGASNTPQPLPITLVVEAKNTNTSILAELEAEASADLPNSGWETLVNDGENCIKSLINNITSPPSAYRLDYTFNVPTGTSTIYIFGEVDVNNDGNDDSFWVQVNGSQTCTWNNLRSLGDGWKRAWVYNQG
ncbi:hypothetical protein KAH55_13730, partial [bacterium]|nr:hypothetical protein [bacterium]